MSTWLKSNSTWLIVITLIAIILIAILIIIFIKNKDALKNSITLLQSSANTEHLIDGKKTTHIDHTIETIAVFPILKDFQEEIKLEPEKEFANTLLKAIQTLPDPSLDLSEIINALNLYIQQNGILLNIDYTFPSITFFQILFLIRDEYKDEEYAKFDEKLKYFFSFTDSFEKVLQTLIGEMVVVTHPGDENSNLFGISLEESKDPDTALHFECESNAKKPIFLFLNFLKPKDMPQHSFLSIRYAGIEYEMICAMQNIKANENSNQAKYFYKRNSPNEFILDVIKDKGINSISCRYGNEEMCDILKNCSFESVYRKKG